MEDHDSHWWVHVHLSWFNEVNEALHDKYIIAYVYNSLHTIGIYDNSGEYLA